MAFMRSFVLKRYLNRVYCGLENDHDLCETIRKGVEKHFTLPVHHWLTVLFYLLQVRQNWPGR